MREVNTGGLYQFLGIEEHVVIAATVGVCRVANVGELREVNRFRGVHDTVAVIVVLAGAVFVVVVPLSEHETGVIRTVLGVIDGHGGIVAGVHITALVNGVEGVSVILEVEGDEVATHAGQIDVRDGEGFVGPSIVITQGSGITRVAEPVGVVVEDLSGTAVLVVNRTLGLLVLFVSVALRATLKRLFANSRGRTTVHIGRRGGVDRRFDVKVHRRISVVVGDH